MMFCNFVKENKIISNFKSSNIQNNNTDLFLEHFAIIFIERELNKIVGRSKYTQSYTQNIQLQSSLVVENQYSLGDLVWRIEYFIEVLINTALSCYNQ